MKHRKLKIICILSVLLCFAILFILTLHKKNLVKEAKNLCEINAMTLDNQINGNTFVHYDQDTQQLSFTDNVMMEDTCFSFDVITAIHIENENMNLLDKSSLETHILSSDHASKLKVYWGELFITEQSIQSKIKDSSLILDGMAIVETQSGKIRKSYSLKFHYAYDNQENIVYERTVDVEK